MTASAAGYTSQTSGSFSVSNGATTSGHNFALVQSTVATSTSINAPSITYGQNGSVAVTVTASSTPTGNVTLSVDGGTAVSKALSGGAATFTSTDIAALGTPAAGTHTLHANYAAQGSFGASSADGSLSASPANQAALTLNAASPLAYNASETMSVTGGTTGGTVTYNLVSGSCTITGDSLKANSGGGSCVVTATMAGDSNYNSVTSSQVTVTLAKLDQAALTLNAASPLAFNASETMSVTGGSTNGAVTYNLVSGSCTITGDSLKADSGTGSCALTATMAGNANYNSVTSSQVTVNLAKADQAALTLNAASPLAYNASETVTVSGGSSNGIINLLVSGSCTMTGNSLKADSGSGSCVVTATMAGNDNYNPVTAQVTVTLAMLNQAALSVTGMPASAQVYNSSFNVGASGGSGDGAVTFTASGACSNVNGASQILMVSGTGVCSVTATKASDGNYSQITSAAATVDAAKAAATVSLSDMTQFYTGGPLSPTAVTSPAGLSVILTGAPVSTLGAHAVVATIDDANYIGTASGSFVILLQGVDLMEDGVSISGATVSGGQVQVSDSVLNLGNTTAGFSMTFFYLSTNGTTKGATLGYRNVGMISGGGSDSSTGTTITLPTGLNGTYYVMACADVYNSVGEVNETNNCTASPSFTIVGPDLTENPVTVSTANPASGGTLLLSDTVVNTGGGNAGATTTLYYLSINGTTKGTNLGSRNVGPLAAGQGSPSVDKTLTLPVNLNGTYYVIACADAYNTVTETNETNNCIKSNSFTVAGANLTETSVVVQTPNPIAQGGTLSVSDTVSNAGAGNAGSSTTLFYLSTNGTTKGTNIGYRNVGALNSQDSSASPATTLTVPRTTGTFYVLACSDAYNQVAEPNETDNCLKSSSTIVIQ